MKDGCAAVAARIDIRKSALTDSAADATRRELRSAYHAALDEMGADAIGELKAWPKRVKAVTQEKFSYRCASAT